MKKFLLLVIILLFGIGGSYAFLRYQKYYREPVPEAVDVTQIAAQNTQIAHAGNNLETLETNVLESTKNSNSETENVSAQNQITLPPELNLKMEFYSQAPFGNWDYPWQEACEEATVLLITHEYKKNNWTREQFNEEILKLVEWEKERFGDYKHTDMQQTQEILEDYLGLQTKIHENPTYEDIQRILSQGHFIVMPAAGKKLGNPYFRNGGPVYHVFPIKGYKEGEKIIVNDVGTKNGADYVYSWKVLEKAFHDYAEPIENGAQKIIEVFPPQT